jgi:hypothetical protein
MRRIPQPTGTSCGQACVATLASVSFRQPTGTSCGQACVATLASVSFRSASRAVADNRSSDEDADYTEAVDLRAALATFGLRLCRRIDAKNWDRISRRALVAVNSKRHPKGKLTWHWVVFEPDEEGGYVIDPRTRAKAQSKRRDFRNALCLVHYHPITEL